LPIFVVGKRRARGRRRDGVSADSLAGSPRRAQGDRGPVGGREAALARGERRVGRAVDLARVVGRDGGVLLGNREGAVDVAHVVVGKRRARGGGRDGVGGDGLTRSPCRAQGDRGRVGGREAALARGERRDRRAVDLAVVDGRDGGVLLGNREGGGVIGDVVVTQHASRAECRADRVWAACHSVPRRAAVRRSYTIAGQEAIERPGQR